MRETGRDEPVAVPVQAVEVLDVQDTEAPGPQGIVHSLQRSEKVVIAELVGQRVAHGKDTVIRSPRLQLFHVAQTKRHIQAAGSEVLPGDFQHVGRSVHAFDLVAHTGKQGTVEACAAVAVEDRAHVPGQDAPEERLFLAPPALPLHQPVEAPGKVLVAVHREEYGRAIRL